MRVNAVLEQIYPSRIRAIGALRGAPIAVDEMKEAAARVCEAADKLGRAPAAKLWRAFGQAVECVALVEAWRYAVLSGEAEADRFLRAARAHFQVMAEAAGGTVFEQALLSLLRPMEGEISISDAAGLRTQLATISMPVAMYSDPAPVLPDWARDQQRPERERPEDLAVAFLEFSINGQPAERVHWLPSRQTNDLEIAIRVSRWPAGAKAIRLSPVSIEPESTFDLPVFEFEKPKGKPPHLFKQRGRMIIHAPQSFHAHPYEFMYAAEFAPVQSEQPVIVAGLRTLRLDGSDLSQTPITGYPAIDRRILELRERMRLEPRISEDELGNALTLLASLGNLMGQAVQDARYPDPIYEAAFQDDVREFLRRAPAIGVELEEQAFSTGGKTDLSFRGIRIELKSERKRRLTPKDCAQYSQQAASYGVGTNKRLAFLCVLDCSPKQEPPFPMEDGLLIIPVETATAPVYVVTCLFQGGIPKPSALS
jgi:hypothetical protein